jgi:hypothetical protein
MKTRVIQDDPDDENTPAVVIARADERDPRAARDEPRHRGGRTSPPAYAPLDDLAEGTDRDERT